MQHKTAPSTHWFNITGIPRRFSIGRFLRMSPPILHIALLRGVDRNSDGNIHHRHFSLFAPLGINNTRLIPQQALSSICNVDDIEGYLSERESDRQKTYLNVIDLPKAGRSKIMEE